MQGKNPYAPDASGARYSGTGCVLLDSRHLQHQAKDLDREVPSSRTLQSGHPSVGGGPYPFIAVARIASRFLAPMLAARLEASRRITTTLAGAPAESGLVLWRHTHETDSPAHWEFVPGTRR